MNADWLRKSERKRERNGQMSWNKTHERIGECCSCLSIWSGCFSEADLQGDKTEHLFELQILKCQVCLYESGQDYWSQMAVWGFGPRQSFQATRQRHRVSAGVWRNRQNWGGPITRLNKNACVRPCICSYAFVCVNHLNQTLSIVNLATHGQSCMLTVHDFGSNELLFGVFISQWNVLPDVYLAALNAEQNSARWNDSLRCPVPLPTEGEACNGCRHTHAAGPALP